MQVIAEIAPLREQILQWRREGQRIAFVPTMGHLHDGHLTLVRRARENADVVVVSIFVNPMQFDKADDLAAYPRTLDEDLSKLNGEGVEVVFTPSADVMYPNGMDQHSYVDVPGLSGVMEGASRPGHFRGVATVVSKLFNMVQPDVACFGEKDFQQLAVINKMVADLCLPIEIIPVATVREMDGLAMSSRNTRLTVDERNARRCWLKPYAGSAARCAADARTTVSWYWTAMTSCAQQAWSRTKSLFAMPTRFSLSTSTPPKPWYWRQPSSARSG